MRLALRKVVTILVLAQIFLVMMFVNFQNVPISRAQETLPVVKVVDANTGSSSISLGSPSDEMPVGGYSFTVDVMLDGLAPSLFLYQVGLSFNISNIQCTAAWIPTNDPNFVFGTKQTVLGSTLIDNQLLGYAFLGASLLKSTDAVDVTQGLLVKANFTVLKTGSLSINVIPTTENSGDPYYGRDTLLAYLYNKNPVSIAFDSQSLSVIVTAKPSPPRPSFDITPANPKANETITFDASASYDPDGFIVSYSWDFGDGFNTSTTLDTINHTFTLNGVHLVNLTVTDNEGFNGSIVEEVPVGAIPVPIFTYDWEQKDQYPSYPFMNVPVTFNASLSYDRESRTAELPNGNITLYVWNFTRFQFHIEDVVVTYLPVEVDNETTTNATLIHTFTANSIYTVNLTIFNNEGLFNSTVQDVIVGIPPVANFTCSPQPAMPNEEILFNAYQGATGEPLTYPGYVGTELVFALWDFGEINVTAVNVTRLSDLVTTHTFLGQGGVFPVNLTVFDDDGLYTSVMNAVNVTIIFEPAQVSSDWQGYAAAGAVFGIIVAATVWYRRRPEKEPDQRDRYRVI